MSKIRVLPEILSNKIAAGEVVERPSSVVKELVENALDAGTAKIQIRIGQGGLSLIQVGDDGCGMSRDDALLSIERYATSKIYQDEDLFAIRTLGFRGEALPSIASVSRFVLETREKSADVGTRIALTGGRLTDVSEAGVPPGTRVSVADLFFNVPARRKFLKSIQTETAHILDAVAAIALGNPSVAFHVIHNDKPVKIWAPAAASEDRVTDVLGRDIRGALFKIRTETPHASLTGWIAAPQASRTSSKGIYVFVNGRWVRDRVIQHALMEGYAGRMMKGRFPLAALFLDAPPGEMDVNVHPAKSEIRLIRSREIHRMVVDAVIRALTDADKIRRYSPPEPSPPEPQDFLPEQRPALSEPFSEYASPAPDSSFRKAPSVPEPPAARREPVQTPLRREGYFSALRIIGQLHATYILAESGEDLILIDQHAAHERILFERLKSRRNGRPIESQTLLIPETVDLTHHEAAVLFPLIPECGAVGLSLEPFGGNTVIVTAAPSLISGRPLRPLILQLIEKASEFGVDAPVDHLLDEVLILIACHGAIRAHQTLSREDIRHLLEEMDRCPASSHCPHGRPTWMKWNLRFFEKAFRRIP